MPRHFEDKSLRSVTLFMDNSWMKSQNRGKKIILLGVLITLGALLAYGWSDYKRGVSEGYDHSSSGY